MPQRSSSTSSSETTPRGAVAEPLPRPPLAPPAINPGKAAREWESDTLTIEPKTLVREFRVTSTRRRFRDAGIVALWMIAFLILADIAINFLFPMPSDQRIQPSGMQSYFDYGRSLEG